MAKKLRHRAADRDLEIERFQARVENIGGEVVRYDAPRGWVEDLIDDTGLRPESTDQEIEEAATSWAQDKGCYADPEGEEP